MIELVFPNNDFKEHYYGRHPCFLFRYAELASNVNYKFIPTTDKVWCKGRISFLVNGKQVVADWADFYANDAVVGWDPLKYSQFPYFKYHYSHAEHRIIPYEYPLGPSLIMPTSIEIYKTYFDIHNSNIYQPKPDGIIQSKQRGYGNAKHRRPAVQDLLASQYGHKFDRNMIDKIAFWRSQSEVLVNVCIPGQREDILDRQQLELMGLGVCTISTKINDVLARFKELIPNEHYIVCKSNFSDLIQKIEFCKANTQFCKEIGNNAKRLFKELYTPENYWKWIEEKTNEFYG